MPKCFKCGKEVNNFPKYLDKSSKIKTVHTTCINPNYRKCAVVQIISNDYYAKK